MKKSHFTETQIVEALKRHKNGQAVADFAREPGITPETFYACQINTLAWMMAISND